MRTTTARATARMSRVLGAVLLMGGAVLAAAPGASASTAPPAPPEPKLIDATVSGCTAPCAPGESGQVELVFDIPAGSWYDFAYANGVPVQWITEGSTTPDTHRHYFYSICSGIRQPFEGCTSQQQVDAVRGAESFTVTAMNCTTDPNVPFQCTESPKSNALVPRQL
jgi:hypothetical protein